jgi:hypothetical protein
LRSGSFFCHHDASPAETYSQETYVIDLAELRQIVSQMQQENEREAG